MSSTRTCQEQAFKTAPTARTQLAPQGPLPAVHVFTVISRLKVGTSNLKRNRTRASARCQQRPSFAALARRLACNETVPQDTPAQLPFSSAQPPATPAPRLHMGAWFDLWNLLLHNVPAHNTAVLHINSRLLASNHVNPSSTSL